MPRHSWILIALAGLALVPGIAAMDGPAGLLAGVVGYGLVLTGGAGFAWSRIFAVRAARRPGDDRYDPVHDAA